MAIRQVELMHASWLWLAGADWVQRSTVFEHIRRFDVYEPDGPTTFVDPVRAAGAASFEVAIWNASADVIVLVEIAPEGIIDGGRLSAWLTFLRNRHVHVQPVATFALNDIMTGEDFSSLIDALVGVRSGRIGWRTGTREDYIGSIWAEPPRLGQPKAIRDTFYAEAPAGTTRPRPYERGEALGMLPSAGDDVDFFTKRRRGVEFPRLSPGRPPARSLLDQG